MLDLAQVDASSIGHLLFNFALLRDFCLRLDLVRLFARVYGERHNLLVDAVLHVRKDEGVLALLRRVKSEYSLVMFAATVDDLVARVQDEEVDAAVDTLTSMIEPLIIVFLGVVIGGILIAMYMPMFSLADTVQ